MAVGNSRNPDAQSLHTRGQQATSKRARSSSLSAQATDLNQGSAEEVSSRAPRVGHKKSRKGCSQCKRRHVKCNEESPCSNCARHGVACSLAGGPNVPREDAKPQRRTSAASSSGASRTASQDATYQNSITASASSTTETSSHPSPLTVLTGLIDRPIAGLEQDNTWMLDLQLMYYYLTPTKYILTEHSDMEFITRIWQEELPKVAFEADYCMHAMLGFAALHRAYLHPNEARMLRTCAVDHLDKALVLYRQHGTPTTAENANAKFAFTWLVALFAYAVPPSVPPIDAIVELFLLVKGIDTVLAETWFWVSQGPFAPVLARGMGEAITLPLGEYTVPEGMDFGLGHLDYMFSIDAMLPDDQRVCALILAELKQIYDSVLRQQGQCSIASILCFPKQNSGPFSQMIKRRLPQSLVILGYYCVLLDVLDNRWWIHGWASRVLQDVLKTLPEQWQTWVEWPITCILLKERPAPGPADLLI